MNPSWNIWHILRGSHLWFISDFYISYPTNLGWLEVVVLFCRVMPRLTSSTPAVSGVSWTLQEKKHGIFWMKRGTCWGKVLDDGWIDFGCFRQEKHGFLLKVDTAQNCGKRTRAMNQSFVYHAKNPVCARAKNDQRVIRPRIIELAEEGPQWAKHPELSSGCLAHWRPLLWDQKVEEMHGTFVWATWKG